VATLQAYELQETPRGDNPIFSRRGRLSPLPADSVNLLPRHQNAAMEKEIEEVENIDYPRCHRPLSDPLDRASSLGDT